MGLITKKKTWSDNENVTYTDINSNFDTVYNCVNGAISNANVSSSAGIVSTKFAVSDTWSGFDHTGTYTTLDQHIADAEAHSGGKGLAQFERFRYNVLETGTNICPRWYNKTGESKTITAVFVMVETAPTGASLVVDVSKNGTTIFSTQTNRPTIASGSTSGTSGTPDTQAVADGDYLTFDIDQVGSTIPGADLLIVVYFE